MATDERPVGDEGAEEVTGFDLVGVLKDYGRIIVRATLAVTALVAAVGAAYLWGLQPVRRMWWLEFRPTFAGAQEGQYPNGLLFSSSDVTAPPVIQRVFEANRIDQVCSLEDFRAGLFIEQRSLEFALLDLEFQSRLSEARLTAVERQRLQGEYRARIEALPIKYRLVFIRPERCNAIPDIVINKALTDVLTVWAEDSESKRGVLNVRVQMLTPHMLDVGMEPSASSLIRADLIRSALHRFVENVRAVEELPGANLIRLGDRRTTLAEVRTKFQALVQSRLEPLVIEAGRGMGREAIAWADEALTAAAREQQVAVGKARAYLDALREYSGTSQSATSAQSPDSPTTSSDVQALTPQIDRTFIDRIVEMSEPNTEFRQEMTRLMVMANLDAVGHLGSVSHYRHLAESLRRSGPAALTQGEVNRRLAQIVTDGKELATQFNALYDEFSRVSFGSSALLYQVDQPVRAETQKPFSLRAYAMLVAATALLSFLAGLAVATVRRRMRATPVTS